MAFGPVRYACCGSAKGIEMQAPRADADAFAANILPVVRQIQAAGATTPRGA
jgi:hypothetical protein